MYNATQQLIDMTSWMQLPAEGRFVLNARSVPNEHLIQFYVDYGMSDVGPWAVIGVQSTEITVGYPPSHTFIPKIVADDGTATQDPAQG